MNLNSFNTILISKQSLLNNLQTFQTTFPQHDIIPVIKSNAYGLGLTQIFNLIKNNVHQIAVASISEARLVKNISSNHRITVLSILEPELVGYAIKHQIELPIYNQYWLKYVSAIAKQTSSIANIHLKIDTGTHRVGFKPKIAPQIVTQIINDPYLNLVGVFSHYASSEEDPDYTLKQTTAFDRVINEIFKTNPKLNQQSLQIHMSCSAASTVNTIPKTSNAIRLGLALYGYWPSPKTQQLNQFKIELKPTLTLKTKIIHLQQLEANKPIGYGGSYVTKSPSIIATLPIGYYDGLSRQLSNKGYVLINNQLCPIVGRICMNLSMVDVTQVKNPKINDEVIIIGNQHPKITPEYIASITNTINYEVISKLPSHLNRQVI